MPKSIGRLAIDAASNYKVMARLSSFCGDIKELVSLKIKRVVSAYSVLLIQLYHHIKQP